VVPWRELCTLVEPHYPKPGSGRPPVGVERMRGLVRHRVRSKVEHVFAVMKLKFGFVKLRYRGLTTPKSRAYSEFP
jgi:IS5 family transposase